MIHSLKLFPVACLLASLLATASCSKKSDVDLIRRTIEKGAELAEQHDIGELLDLGTADLVADPGSHNARSIRGILFIAFQRYGRIKIHFPQPAVKMDDAPATASARVYFVIVSQDKPMPGLKELYDDPQAWLEMAGEKADLYQLDLDFVKNDGDWQVKKAHIMGLGI